MVEQSPLPEGKGHVELFGRPVALAGNVFDIPFVEAAAGRYEPETFAALARYVTPEVTYLDVGAHVGVMLLFAAHGARFAVGLEPDPVAFAELERRVSRCPDAGRIQILPVALAPRPGSVRLGNRNQVGNSGSSVYWAEQPGHWEAEAVCLDGLAARLDLQGPLFIKMDIEGAEFEVLPAGRAFLRRGEVHGLSLALHPWIYLDRGRIPPRGLFQRLVRRVRHIVNHVRLFRALWVFEEWRDAGGRRVRVPKACWRLLLGRAAIPGNALLCVRAGKSETPGAGPDVPG